MVLTGFLRRDDLDKANTPPSKPSAFHAAITRGLQWVRAQMFNLPLPFSDV